MKSIMRLKILRSSFQYFFTHGFLLSRKEFFIVFHVQPLRFHAWIFWRKFHAENCVSRTLKKKITQNWLSRILSKKHFSEELHFFTYKIKTLGRGTQYETGNKCTILQIYNRDPKRLKMKSTLKRKFLNTNVVIPKNSFSKNRRE